MVHELCQVIPNDFSSMNECSICSKTCSWKNTNLCVKGHHKWPVRSKHGVHNILYFKVFARMALMVTDLPGSTGHEHKKRGWKLCTLELCENWVHLQLNGNLPGRHRCNSCALMHTQRKNNVALMCVRGFMINKWNLWCKVAHEWRGDAEWNASFPKFKCRHMYRTRLYDILWSNYHSFGRAVRRALPQCVAKGLSRM